ncbi:glycosylphosphatidylinositol anchored membrane protein boudin isoform X1 [Ptiloglossa arizonensis]|uniref:glycosylphosphatidylinositol anchored membrane protein boudin isoform X1 n=1 Tax=Ptiloglossa arizonensis TaxID=3350558 RepID=UPI003FA11E18
MGANNSIKGHALFAVLLLFVETVHSLECYQCISTNNSHPFQCNEFLSSDIDIEPQPCDDVFDAQYCVKHTGRFEGGIGTKRFCSALDLGNYCHYVTQQGDKLTYRTCIYTCTGDGCNPATSFKPTIAWTIPIGLLIAYKLLFQR